MALLARRLKRITPFAYILLALLVFTFLFNLKSQWEAISLIVRIYIYVFCFYLIFNFSSANLDRYEKLYQKKFGKWAEEILFLEVRVMPFLIIYCIIILFALADSVRSTAWPWTAFMDLLGGRYANLMVYSLFLLFVLKLKRDPFFTIPIFLTLCVAYFYIDRLIDTVLDGGLAVQLILTVKFVIFFFFLFVEFFVRRRLYKLLTTAAVVSLVTSVVYVGVLRIVYHNSTQGSYPQKQSGLYLLRLGYQFPLNQLKSFVGVRRDAVLFKQLIGYAKKYDMVLNFTDAEWENLLFSESVETADMVAEYILDREIPISYKKMFEYTEKKSMEPKVRPTNWANYIKLAARSVSGNRSYVLVHLKSPNRKFVQWCLAVIGEMQSPELIPPLIGFLTDINTDLSETAYVSLTNITKLNPKETLNRRINDPEVIRIFHQYYLEHRKDD